MDLELLVTEGLGDNSYVLSSQGEAVVVDPQRDVRRYVEVAETKGLRIAFTLETHLHNDFVSGARELQEATGAEIVAPSRGGYEFPHRGVVEGDELSVGGLRLMAIETPGHTPEHISYVVYEPGADVPAAVFTGGSLMVGGAGRTDLLGDGQADALTRAQFRTLRRLSGFPDTVAVLPTHGAGSFCGAGPVPTERTSTFAEERGRNTALAAPDEESFVRRQLTGLLSYPAYYRHMAPINRKGPAVLGAMPRPKDLGPEEFAARMGAGAWAVDGRWRGQFARAHIPGSVNVELDDTFGSYVGWVVPFGDPVVLVLPEPEEDALEEAADQLIRIGYERLDGYLVGGIPAWTGAGRPTRTYPVTGLEELCRRISSGAEVDVLDVRQRTEWDDGHIRGSQHLFVGDLPGRLEEVNPRGEAWVICATGHRASTASSLLDRADVPVRLVDGTGVVDFLKHCAPDLREPAAPVRGSKPA